MAARSLQLQKLTDSEVLRIDAIRRREMNARKRKMGGGGRGMFSKKQEEQPDTNNNEDQSVDLSEREDIEDIIKEESLEESPRLERKATANKLVSQKIRYEKEL